MVKYINLRLSGKDEDVEELRRPLYPWGLKLTVDGDLIDDLSLDEFDVGDMVNVQAVGKIVSVSENVGDKDVDRSVTIQLIKMRPVTPVDEEGNEKIEFYAES